jgi:two-component system sensor histidine kinase TctE
VRYHDEPIRVVVLNKPVISGQVRIEVAQTRSERRLLAMELALSTAWRLLLLIAVAGALIWIGVQRNLAPLTALRQELQRRSARDLQPLTASAPSEIVPLIAAINQLMARLEHSIGVMQRFIADAAHQLRTPLAVLQTQADLALREDSSAALRTTLSQLQDSTRRATRLANQLLDHARASSDISTLAIAPLDLSALAADTTRELVPLALRHAIDLGLEADPDIAVQGDGILLRELLKNLIDNAIRYCPGGACITVRVSAVSPAGACLEVEDTGPGIAPAERQRVFDRFYRIPGSHTDGSGLGLAIVKQIVQAHGGRISLDEGAAGRGLKVQVLLPGPIMVDQ